MYINVHCNIIYIDKILKQPKCPSVDEWIKKKWYIYITKYYSAITKNKCWPFATTRMDLRGVLLSEVSQTEKDKYCMISLNTGNFEVSIN